MMMMIYFLLTIYKVTLNQTNIYNDIQTRNKKSLSFKEYLRLPGLKREKKEKNVDKN